MAGCIMHQEVPTEAPEREVQINGQRVKVTLDTASSISLIQPHLLKTEKPGWAVLPITCVHGDTTFVPAHTVTICCARLLDSAGGSSKGPSCTLIAGPGLTRAGQTTSAPAHHPKTTQKSQQPTGLFLLQRAKKRVSPIMRT